ncbi:MAG: hypothetical protein IJV94_03480 [Bacilli bacterium]|nr:hypothetical protein [Bacilli bacterium]
MGKNIIKAIDENGNTFIYRDLKEASQAIEKYSKMEDWKIQLYIAYAITSNKKAFKHKWMRVK